MARKLMRKLVRKLGGREWTTKTFRRPAKAKKPLKKLKKPVSSSRKKTRTSRRRIDPDSEYAHKRWRDKRIKQLEDALRKGFKK